MELKELRIKNYSDYLNGREVEALVELTKDTILKPGERVLVYKDSVSIASSVPVPREKQHQSIGVEGVVTQAQIIEPVQDGAIKQVLRIKKE
ncbi:hypothetical protein [Chryseosolibacter indicus]|uniref:Uncharacterized protein n=1 Tax=Chryseosolibacter indicus TaxID=2782351 RepID=A0ABS5VWA3_9BACT|nr:hypothetical protein [Chryseosolibacter indicus]MBT1705699.1 hypothetical protein [Chryseosolibacter indicus]